MICSPNSKKSVLMGIWSIFLFSLFMFSFWHSRNVFLEHLISRENAFLLDSLCCSKSDLFISRIFLNFLESISEIFGHPIAGLVALLMDCLCNIKLDLLISLIFLYFFWCLYSSRFFPPVAETCFLGIWLIAGGIALLLDYLCNPKFDLHYILLLRKLIFFFSFSTTFLFPRCRNVFFGHLIAGVITLSLDYLCNPKFDLNYIPPWVAAPLCPGFSMGLQVC